jgi:choline dehydrogenase-like flavoprotein
MFLNARELPNDEVIQAEVCIIGAGAAGITLACQLASTGLNIVLLESGDLSFEPATQSLYDGHISGQAYFDLDEARLRYFGGTTNHWTGWCRPLDPIDFENRPYIPDSGWPISAEDVAPYYHEASKLCQLGEDGFETAAFLDRIPPLFGQPLSDLGAVTRIWQHSPPTRFGEVYREAIAGAETVRCFLNANVVEFEVADGNRTVIALKAKTLGGNGFRVVSRLFVLACGGLENARLMLQPTEKLPEGLGNETDQIGRYFMLHPILEAGTLVTAGDAARQFHSDVQDYGETLRAGLSLPEPLQREWQLPNHAVQFERHYHAASKAPLGYRVLQQRLKNPFSRNGHSLQSDIVKIFYDLDDIAGHVYGKVANKLSRLAGQHWESDEQVYTILVRMEHQPNADSRVRLDSARDALGLQRIVLDWRFSAGERDGVRRTVEHIGRVIGALSAGRIQVAEWLHNEEGRDWPNWVNGDYHHMGTTRMSATPATGVVDETCRVHGLSNFYVAGSSVFPSGGFANPTLTIVALTLRLADHIKGKFHVQTSSETRLPIPDTPMIK